MTKSLYLNNVTPDTLSVKALNDGVFVGCIIEKYCRVIIKK